MRQNCASYCRARILSPVKGGYNLKLEFAFVQVIVRSSSLLFFLLAIFFQLPVTRKPGKPHAGG
jgi:hypothetical protein